MRDTFPFSAIAGQEELKRSLLIAAIDPAIGGVLAFGDRGTGKSTAVRALARLLPALPVIEGCRFRCDPGDPAHWCSECRATPRPGTRTAPIPVVDLPLGATADRIVGALDLERALVHGQKSFEPGLLAEANRGFLYIDEVNLLEDHLIDLLIDVAASGENVVEREGISLRHPARFVLVGSGNPEEGELRPQLLDRFGLCVEVHTPADIPTRVTIIKRRDAFDRDPAGFSAAWREAETAQREALGRARERLPDLEIEDAVLEDAATLCQRLGTDGLRGELTLIRAARAFAALGDDPAVTRAHLIAVAPSALRHRLRRDPLDESVATARVGRAVADLFPA